VKKKTPVPKPEPKTPCPDAFTHTQMDLTNEKQKVEGKMDGDDCAKKCTGNSKCVGYEWNGKGDRTCKTKTDFNPSAGKQSSAWTSCILNKCAPGYSWTKMDMTNEAQKVQGAKDTSKECAKICSADSKCTAYEWHGLGARTCKTKTSFNAYAGDQSKEWYSCVRGEWKTGPVGKVVVLHSKTHNRFIRMNNKADMDTSSTKSIKDIPAASSWTWERFTLVDAGGGEVALHNRIHNRFVRMNNKADMDTSSTKAIKDLPSATQWPWERFQVVNAKGGEIALHSKTHNRFIRMNNKAAMDVSSTKAVKDLPPAKSWPWERFMLVVDR